MSKATESELSTLHKKVAESMISALDQSDRATRLLLKYMGEGSDVTLPGDVAQFLEDAREINPSLLTSAAKFLKDNNISCDVGEDEDLAELEDRLKQKRKSNVASIGFDD